jgi:molybdopterin converting factor small subunit
VQVVGRTVGDALAHLVARYPGLADELFAESGELRPALHLFLDERDVQSLEGLATPLPDAAKLILVLPISGGCPGRLACSGEAERVSDPIQLQ